MDGRKGWNRWLILGVALLLLGGVLNPVLAYKVKDPRASLDSRVFVRPELRVTDTVELSDHIRGVLPNAKEMDGFVADNGTNWVFFVDQRTGRVSLLDGGALPFIPGPMNSLRFDDFASGCTENQCLPVAQVEKLAREFLAKYQDVFRLNPDEFVLDPNGSGPVWNQYYFLRFQWMPAGIPVEGGSIFFRINNGNLLQVATERIGDFKLDPNPNIDLGTAWESLRGYLGEDAPDDRDEVVEPGRIFIIPITPVGDSADVFNGRFGQQIDYRLVYKMAFRRPGVQGTWEAVVDAHTGEILRFVDANEYGHIHGGIRPSDGLPPEEDRPFSYADIGGGLYADGSGNFTGTSATTTLVGKYTHISDGCGTISASTTTGDINFGMGPSDNNLTDCNTPTGNTYGAGNTKPSRTLFYNCTAINLKAQIYSPSNTWLTSTYITCNVNGSPSCNASSGGGVVNFYKKSSGCNNLGEIPGVAMHEWAHSFDPNDGSGAKTPPLETYADWTAIIQTHNSCTGAGFLTSSNCGGYGDACTGCTGVRDCDYTKHAANTPWTSANQGSVWSCSGGSYFGPCGWEDHCESGISTQALWDFVYRDLTDTSASGPMYPNALDMTTAWMLEDRLWFTGVQTLTASYTCSSGTTSGCSGTVLYSVMRALDDDGDGTANGTPHAHAIYHAMRRHLIDCNTYNDTSPQNQNQTSCPTLTTPTLSAVAGNNQVVLNWTTGGGSCTRYFIYKNESGCDVAFNRIAIVTAPTLTYTDNACVNGVVYYYRIQAVTASDSCVSPSSNCMSVTPQPCAASVSLDRGLFSCSDTVTVSVLDSTPGSSPWTATAWSTSDATPQTVTLTNNPPGSAIYKGTFATTTGTGGAGVVHVANGNTLTVKFTDPDYCGAGSHDVTATATIDCVGPTISSVVVSGVTGNGATVTWTTNENANSRVTYGTGTPPGTNGDDLITYVTSHSLQLSGLSPCTQYYFSVTSADVAGNGVTDTNGGAYYTFTTPNVNQTLFSENFSGVTTPALPTGWTTSSTSGNAWVTNSSGCTNNALMYPYNGSAAANSWAYTPGIALTAGVTYTLSCNQKVYSGTYPEIFEIKCGAAATPAGQTITILASSSYTNTTCTARTGTFTVPSSGTYFVGFHCTSAANMWNLYIDDIVVSKPGSCGPDLAYQSNTYTDYCPSGGTGNGDTYIDPGETVTVHPVLVNSGGNATGISATLTTTTTGITILNGTATYPNLGPLGSGACDPPHFTYSVGAGVACGTVIDFTLTFTALGGGPWTGNFTHTVGHVLSGNTTPINEAFTTGNPPTGWTRTNGGTGTQQWTTANPGSRTAPSGITAPFEIIDSDNDGSGVTQDDSLISPAFDCTGATTVTLTFDTYYYAYSNSVADVDVSKDNGSTWTTNVAHWTTSSIGSSSAASHQSISITTAAGGAAQVKVRFHYTGTYAWYWMVDNVKVDITKPGGCNMTACSASCTPPGAPNLTSATGTCSGVTLNWTAGTGTTNAYNVYRSSNTSCPVGTLTKLNASPLSSSTLTYGDTTAVAGTSYTYVVRDACDSGGATESANSNCRAAARLVSPTPTITGASANACPATTVVLTTESGKTSYQWYNGGSPVSGANAYQYTVTATGSFTVSYTDSNGCGGTSASKAVTIAACAAALSYDASYNPLTSLVEICGDGDSTVEPGEDWQVTVRLKNTGNLDATLSVASLTVDAGSAVTGTVTGNPGSYGTVNQGGGTSTAGFVFHVDSGATCVNNLTFDITGISSAEGSYPSQIPAFAVQVGASSTQSETATQATTPLNATSATANSNLTPAFTITSPDAVSLSYTSNYAQKPGGTVTLLASDDMATLGNWTAAGSAAVATGTAHCSHTTSVAQLPGGTPNGSITLTNAVSTVGLTNIQVTYDYRVSNTGNGTACRLDWSADNGATWTNGTGAGTTTWVCGNVATLPAGAEGAAQLKIRFVNPGTNTTRYAHVDYVSITGTSAASGSWTANARVSLVDPSSTVTVLKAYGAADASPYDVKDYYTGPGTYVLRLEENSGGTATVTAGSLTAGKTTLHCNASTCGSAPGEAAPGSTPATAQGWTDKTTAVWPSASGATSYRVYRGTQGQLQYLLSGAADSCTKYAGSATSCTENDDPGSVSGRFYWYLVTGSNLNGEGPAGNHTSGAGGPRVVNTIGNCP